MGLQIIPTGGFDKQLLEGVRRESIIQIERKVAANANRLKFLFGDILSRVFGATEVARSLLGGGAIDLQAHLGLTAGEAGGLVGGMESVIKQEIEISTSRNPTRIIAIRAINAAYSQMLALPGAEHTNKSGITVPVAAWMLISPNIDIGQAAYDIILKGQRSGQFDNTIDRVSRSGRAIMVSLSTLGGGASYVLPSILRGAGGKNFIELAMQQQVVIDELGKVLLQGLS